MKQFIVPPLAKQNNYVLKVFLMFILNSFFVIDLIHV